MSKFDDNYRAGAVVMLQTEGYPQDEFAIGRVHTYLKQRSPYPSKATLINWFTGASNPPPLKNLNDKKRDMVDALQALTWKLVDHATLDGTISEMSGQSTITSIGILIDKTRLLLDKPTEISKSESTNTTVNLNAENAHDAGNILRQLIELGAIPPERGEGGHDPAPE